jgi:hypothetical protein
MYNVGPFFIFPLVYLGPCFQGNVAILQSDPNFK